MRYVTGIDEQGGAIEVKDPHTARLRAVLQLDASGAGRPEDVVDALDLPLRARRAVRTRLLFVDTPPIAR